MEDVLKKLVICKRLKNDRKCNMSLGSFDAQNVKNTESTEKNDYDGVKKILADGGYTAKPFAEKLKKF